MQCNNYRSSGILPENIFRGLSWVIYASREFRAFIESPPDVGLASTALWRVPPYPPVATGGPFPQATALPYPTLSLPLSPQCLALRNGDDNGRTMAFGLTCKMGERQPGKWEKWPENGSEMEFRAVFPFSGPFFPHFPWGPKDWKYFSISLEIFKLDWKFFNLWALREMGFDRCNRILTGFYLSTLSRYAFWLWKHMIQGI